MDIKQLSVFSKDNTETLCLFTDADHLTHLKQAFPELASYLDAEMLELDSQSILSLPQVINGKKYQYYLMGLATDSTPEMIQAAFGSVAKKFSESKKDTVTVHMAFASIVLKDEALFLAAMKGLAHGSYVLNKFKTSGKENEPYKGPSAPGEILIFTDTVQTEGWLKVANQIITASLLTRTLVDEPANHLRPAQLADKAIEALEGTEVHVKVLEKNQIQSLGMNLFMAVAKGSTSEPKLIVMSYRGNPDSSETIGLIGKGLTYDSGGYSIKPTNGMLTMKCDMGGAGAVIGAMKLLAMQKPKVNVVGVVAACENMISGNSYLPGDIITSMNGKTVEIGNTDAEGRLTLADAMTYAIRYEGATKLVDICTLTGACLVALGEEYAGVVTWEDELWDKVAKASEATLEPCWRLPLNKTLKDKNKGKIADLNNNGGRNAGSQVAGAFVGEFCEEKPWIHIDIAGTAFIDEEKPHLRSGATGYGAHLLFELAKEL